MGGDDDGFLSKQLLEVKQLKLENLRNAQQKFAKLRVYFFYGTKGDVKTMNAKNIVSIPSPFPYYNGNFNVLLST